MKTTLIIDGMSCGNCVRHVREALEKLPGVTNADVSLEEKRAVVEHDGQVSTATMVAAIADEGYTAQEG